MDATCEWCKKNFKKEKYTKTRFCSDRCGRLSYISKKVSKNCQNSQVVID